MVSIIEIVIEILLCFRVRFLFQVINRTDFIAKPTFAHFGGCALCNEQCTLKSARNYRALRAAPHIRHPTIIGYSSIIRVLISIAIGCLILRYNAPTQKKLFQGCATPQKFV